VDAGVRVTYVARRAHPAVGGIETHLRFLTDALPPLERVQILTPRVDDGWPHYTDVLARGSFEPFARGQVPTEPLRARHPRLLPVAAERLLQWAPRGRGWVGRRSFHGYAAGVGPAIAAAADRPAVLHVLSGGNLAAATALAARRLSVPVVMTPSAHPGQWDDDPLSGAAYRAADLVLAWSDADAETYRRLGVSPQRLRISPPAGAPLSPGGGAALRASHGIAGPLVVFVGRRQAYKGAGLLIEAARRASFTAVLVGPGDPVRETGVIDAGRVTDEARAAWVDAADVLAMPSSHESFGLAVAEAWSVGTPVVTSDIPVLRALVEAAGGGLAVARDPVSIAGAIEAIAGDPARARALGEAGRRYWRKELSPESAARRTLAAYEELISRRTSSTRRALRAAS
jgi:glycosyltransferase involved in cell wall biosynthesis